MLHTITVRPVDGKPLWESSENGAYVGVRQFGHADLPFDIDVDKCRQFLEDFRQYVDNFVDHASFCFELHEKSRVVFDPTQTKLEPVVSRVRDWANQWLADNGGS